MNYNDWYFSKYTHIDPSFYAFGEMAWQAAQAAAVPEGWKLLKDSTYEERCWKEDISHENGNYHCVCTNFGRQFVGHKRRVICKACAAEPKPTEDV